MPKHIIMLGLVAMSWFAGAAAQAAPEPTTRPAKAAVLYLHGTVDEYMSAQFERHVGQAREAGATTLILDLNTNGGLVTAGLNMSRYLKNLRGFHTIAFIDNKAYSAGTMIALACDEIVMTHSAVIGDCAPILITEDHHLEPVPPTERAKMASPIIRDFEESAAGKYDLLLVRSMITIGETIHWVENDKHERKFVTEADYKKLTRDGWKAVADLPDPVQDEHTLFTATTSTAIKVGMAKGEAVSVEDLAQQRGLDLVARYNPGLSADVVELLGNIYVRGILLAIFLTALYASLHAPGHGAAEMVALLSLGALLGVPLLTGYAQWWEVMVILVGLLLLAIEIFIFPTVGILAVLGIVMVLGGMVLTFMGSEPGGNGLVPKLPGTWSALQSGLIVVVLGMACSFLLSMWLRQFLPKIPYFNRLILGSAGSSVASVGSAGAIGAWPGVGTIGTAMTDLRPGGSVEFADENGQGRATAVVSDSGFIVRGRRVVVREVAGNRVVVRAVEG